MAAPVSGRHLLVSTRLSRVLASGIIGTPPVGSRPPIQKSERRFGWRVSRGLRRRRADAIALACPRAKVEIATAHAAKGPKRVVCSHSGWALPHVGHATVRSPLGLRDGVNAYSCADSQLEGRVDVRRAKTTFRVLLHHPHHHHQAVSTDFRDDRLARCQTHSEQVMRASDRKTLLVLAELATTLCGTPESRSRPRRTLSASANGINVDVQCSRSARRRAGSCCCHA